MDNTEAILTHIDLVASGWRHEEYEHLTIGNAVAANKCRQSADVLEQLVRDIREQRLTTVDAVAK